LSISLWSGSRQAGLKSSRIAGSACRAAFNAQGFTLTTGEETATEFVSTYGFGWELHGHIRCNSAIRFSSDGQKMLLNSALREATTGTVQIGSSERALPKNAELPKNEKFCLKSLGSISKQSKNH
jgi:hypothetical protein